uniref:Uncharacterized protein n=1 Tax=Haplochromis burtoni TaxID=8153 RepID=A0A3Q2V9S3_HAPBU
RNLKDYPEERITSNFKSCYSSWKDNAFQVEEFGPVFIQEPDDVIFPLDSDEKKVVMHCEARGNPPPTYRCGICLSVC